MRSRKLAVVIALVMPTCSQRSRDEPVAAPIADAPPPIKKAPPKSTPIAATAALPTVPESARAIETGLAPGAVILWPTDNESPGADAVVLFPDELAAVRRAVAAELARRKISLVPIAKLEQIEDNAMASKLVLEGDQVCASPLTRSEVHERYFTRFPKVTIDAACFDGCRLTISVQDEDGDPTSFTSAKVKHPEDPKGWIAAASRLDEELLGIGGLGLYGTSHNPPVRFGPPSWIGPWRTPPTHEQLSALEPRASTCAHPDPMVGLTYEVRARVDRRGRIDRCVAEGPKPLARAVDETCLCDAMADLRFADGAGTRRLRVEAIDDTGFQPSGGALTLVQPGTEVWLERLRGAMALERCAAAHPLGVAIDATVSLRLAPNGAIEDVRIDGDIVDRGAMLWATCVVGELGALALPCRPPGIEVLRTRLVFKPS